MGNNEKDQTTNIILLKLDKIKYSWDFYDRIVLDWEKINSALCDNMLSTKLLNWCKWRQIVLLTHSQLDYNNLIK